MADPKYVRLSDRLSRGMLVDVESHWSIAGLDVVEFPQDEPGAAQYVRDALRRGLLEEAGKAEFEEIQNLNKDLQDKVVLDDEYKKAIQRSHQEADVVRAANRASKRLADARASDGTDVYAQDEKRRKATIKAQKNLDDGAVEGADGDSADAAAAAGAPSPVIGDSPVVEGDVVVKRGDAGKR